MTAEGHASGWPAATSVSGEPATLDAAIDRAAELLGGAASPVIAGVETDDAGARACVDLARLLRAAIGIGSATPMLRDMGVMRTAGWIVTTPLQARARADVVLIVGDGVERAWPTIVHDLAFDRDPNAVADRRRQVLGLGPASLAGLEGLRGFGGGPERIAKLRAMLAGRSFPPDSGGLEECANLLRSAKFGVAVWSAAELDEMSIEMLCGLIDDLNAMTRFCGLPIGPERNALGVAEALASETGFPTAISFHAGFAAHDPWLFDPDRMIEAGEADAAVWVGALGGRPPDWVGRVPTVAIVDRATTFAQAPEACIAVASPGVDHGAVLHERRVGGLAHRAASAATDAPTTAVVARRLAARLAASC